jgi:hypothetical protein
VHLFAWTMCVLSCLEPSPARKWLLISSAATGLVAVAVSTSQTVLDRSVWVPPALYNVFYLFFSRSLTSSTRLPK